MKLCKLKLKNLNSFRRVVEIDFEDPPLNEASLVAITGPTGSGKTTLLDAICVALYGKTPRLSGIGNQNPNHLISHGENEAFAELYFTAKEIRYLARWSIKRNSSAKVSLEYAVSGGLITDRFSPKGKSIGSSQNTVSQEVEAILGLDFGAFRRSVMLAQGEFAAFLKAKPEERRTILEAAAGISIYDDLKEALNRRVREVKEAHAEVREKWIKIPEASPEQLSEAENKLKGLLENAKKLVAQNKKLQAAKSREEKRKEDFEEIQSSEERLKKLANQQTEIDALEKELKAANRAEPLRLQKQAYDTAKSNLETEKGKLKTAKKEKEVAKEKFEADQAKFDQKKQKYAEAEESALMPAMIYELRQRLQAGEPCMVCGSTDHTDAEIAEHEDANFQQAQELLRVKETERDRAEERLQKSRDDWTRKQNTHEMIDGRLKECGKKHERAEAVYKNKLMEVGFNSPEAHEAACRSEAKRKEIDMRINDHNNKKQEISKKIGELRKQFEAAPFDKKALEGILTRAGEVEKQLGETQKNIGETRGEIGGLKKSLESRKKLAAEMRVAERELERWQRLQKIIPENKLRDFALEIMFRQMVDLANGQLTYLTSERYQLKIETTDDQAASKRFQYRLSVVDRWNANDERPVETLSGGESFLTSLALALALSEISQGRAQLNSLFLDEGFGTLDAETLDVALSALEGLRMQGRNIYLISHIQELTKRLPVKINVRKQRSGSSSIKIEPSN